MKNAIRRTIFTILVVILVLVIFNFGYFWDNFTFSFKKPVIQQVQQQQAQALPEKMEPNRLLISSLNLDLPIIYATQNSETEFQQDLENGVVHYPDTAKPGELGNAYIFGHSSDFLWSKGNFKHAFSLLPKIKIGDSIVISNQAGDKFVYVVTGTKIVAPDDKSVLSQQTDGGKILTLQTSYPLGTALKRFIVTAQLLE